MLWVDPEQIAVLQHGVRGMPHFAGQAAHASVVDRIGKVRRLDHVVLARSAACGSAGRPADPRGKLLVGDDNSSELFEIDPDTGAAASLTSGMLLNTPRYVDLGPGDEIFIAEAGQGLSRIDPDLQLATRAASSLVSGKGLVVDKQTRDLYSSSSTEISRFDPDSYNPANPDANREVIFGDDATDVGLLPNGHLVAINSGGSDLLQIDPQTKVGTRVAEGGNLLIPTGLAVVLPAPEPGAAAGMLTAWLAVCVLARDRIP